jgi:hypothetical protein
MMCGLPKPWGGGEKSQLRIGTLVVSPRVIGVPAGRLETMTLYYFPSYWIDPDSCCVSGMNGHWESSNKGEKFSENRTKNVFPHAQSTVQKYSMSWNCSLLIYTKSRRSL